MANEKIYPKGIMCFPANDGAPDFVLGKVMITLNDLVQFAKENESLLSEYKGKKQLKLDLLKGSKGVYLTVDTYVPKNTTQAKKDGGFNPPSTEKDDLPF